MDPVQQQQSQQQQQTVHERQTIWRGVLEWIEKTKNPNGPQKLTRHVPCQVSTYIKEGEPDMKADSWPQKLIMQLMPKQLIGNIGGIYLKNSKSVLFHPLNCEALESLTEVMSSGFAGCVHFTSMSPTSACDIKVLILLYTSEKRAYLGFIPNDQITFVDRLRRVIQQSKLSQALIRQGQEFSQQTPVGPSYAPVRASGQKRKIKENEEEFLESFPENPKELCAYRVSDEFDAIAVNWAAKLRKLDERQCVLAEDLINQVLKKAYFGQLSPNTTYLQ